MTDSNGTVREMAYDGLNRIVACDVTPAPGIIGTTEQRYQYDGLSRIVLVYDNNTPSDDANADNDNSVVEYRYDSDLPPGKRIGSHTFRRSAATHLLRSGVDLRRVQAFLGHTSIESTQPYLRLDVDEIREAVETLAEASASQVSAKKASPSSRSR